MKEPGAVKLSDRNWEFDSGVIAFDDAKYNMAYAQAAADLLGAGNAAADKVFDSGSSREITFTGTLVEWPLGAPDSFETLQKAVLDTGIDSIKLGKRHRFIQALTGNHTCRALAAHRRQRAYGKRSLSRPVVQGDGFRDCFHQEYCL